MVSLPMHLEKIWRHSTKKSPTTTTTSSLLPPPDGKPRKRQEKGSTTPQFYIVSRQSRRQMQSSRKAYLLEQYRHGVLHTEIPNPTASAMPARALDTSPQSAGRRFDANSVLVNTTHAYTPAPLSRQLESPAPIQY